MLTINGKLENLFTKSEYTDKSTGDVTPAKLYLQIMGKFPQEDGGFRLEMKDIKANIKEFDSMLPFKNKDISIAVMPFSPRNSQAIYYSIPRGVLPILATQAPALPEKKV